VVLPLISRCQTLEGLAREMAGNMLAFTQAPLALVIAATVPDLDLDDVALRLRQRLLPYMTAKLDERLIEIKRHLSKI
jgi:hypothetical protein